MSKTHVRRIADAARTTGTSWTGGRVARKP